MTSIENIRYDGPAQVTVRVNPKQAKTEPEKPIQTRTVDLRPLWDEFARQYAVSQAAPADEKSTKPAVNQLNDIAFGQGAGTFLKTLGLTAITSGEQQEKFRVLRYAVEDVCLANSSLTDVDKRANRFRPLNRAIMAALMQQWIELEKAHGLYPPPPSLTPNGNPFPKAFYEERERRWRDFLQIPEAALLAGMLKMLNQSAIRGVTTERFEIFKSKVRDAHVTLDDAHSEASDLFRTSLFKYEDWHGASFPTYVIGRLRNNLLQRLQKLHAAHTEGLPLEGSDDTADDKKGLIAVVRDPRAADPTARAEHYDQLALVRHIITHELGEQEQKIIKKRFGLDPDRKVHTLDELAAEFDLSRERIRQIESHALRLIRAHAHDEMPPEERFEKFPVKEVLPEKRPKTVPAKKILPVEEEPPAQPETPLPFLRPAMPTRDAPDYPYLSLDPAHASLEGDSHVPMKMAESGHITDMLTAGMSCKWTAKPLFYDNVRGQWQAILATRKNIAATSVLDDAEIERVTLNLIRALITHAPDPGHTFITLSSTTPEKAANGLSYNAVYKQFGQIDFRQPSKIAEALVYDPRWRAEVGGYLTHVSSQLMAHQVLDIYKPNCFDPSASFGECLEAYVFCDGKAFDEFLKLYCVAKGYDKHWRGKHIGSPELFGKELNQGATGDRVISNQTIMHWLNTNYKKPSRLTAHQRDIFAQRYELTNRQKKCLTYINGAIASLDSVRTIIEREHERIKSEASPDTHGTASETFMGLVDIQPDLSPEGFAKKLGNAISASPLQRWFKTRSININTLLPYIDEVVSILVPDDPVMARRAANLMLGLPSPEDMTFSESVKYAREQGFTIAEFLDMRRYQLRDDIKRHWQADGGEGKYNAFQAFVAYVTADQPESVELTERKIRNLRDASSENIPPIDTLDFLGKKLGASTRDDLIAFRQLMYALSLDASQEKLSQSLDVMEKTGTDTAARKAAFKQLAADAQERYGFRNGGDLAKRMLQHAKQHGLKVSDSTKPEIIRTALSNLGKQSERTVPEIANIIATYIFQDDPAQQERLRTMITSTKQLTLARDKSGQFAQKTDEETSPDLPPAVQAILDEKRARKNGTLAPVPENGTGPAVRAILDERAEGQSQDAPSPGKARPLKRGPEIS